MLMLYMIYFSDNQSFVVVISVMKADVNLDVSSVEFVCIK